MKKFNTRSYLLGFLSAIIIVSFVVPVFAAGIEATLNSIGIVVNGKQVAKIDESLVLNNGTEVPYSINYKGTNYLPIGKMAELFGFSTGWEGSTRTATLTSETAGKEAPHDVTPATKQADESYYSGWYVPSNLSVLVVAEEETIFQTEKFLLVIPPRNPFHPDIKDLTAALIDEIESVTGLSFSPAGKPFGRVEITNDGNGFPYAHAAGMNADMLSYSFEDVEFAFVHELTHCIQMRNAPIPNAAFMEQYAIVTSIKVAQAQDNTALVGHLRQNYQLYSSENLPDNLIGFDIEAFYRLEAETGWDKYLVGYAFGMYLEAVYGEGIHNQIVIGFSSVNNASNAAFVDFIKEKTSKSVFEDFGEWYGKNRTRIYR